MYVTLLALPDEVELDAGSESRAARHQVIDYKRQLVDHQSQCVHLRQEETEKHGCDHEGHSEENCQTS